ncbi:hypothetical protein CCAX7_24110 [Capsulimonas corticalis]|uniref:Uncharacterized protein n=1 Tax=Capsulimonas corticalis TaxID=2219043 RepID=A0A402CVD8_9BACT|nr:class I SAM-dependent methyltransferase [Capsulimonas corticalis]BDI30360.1 hypothetical protein CCAX7_24110 [Capsulimonas corticalis]
MSIHSPRYHFRRFVLAVTPPILLSAVRRARGLEPAKTPHYTEYTTLDDPLEMANQVESYLFFRDNYIQPSDHILEVGFGLGYGMNIMAAKAISVIGVEVDAPAVARAKRVFDGHPRVTSVSLYDGKRLPFEDQSFDVVTCLEVIEHVEDYEALLRELYRVSRRLVFITTPNRLPEHTLPNGKPMNYWHLREWSHPELDKIITGLGYRCDWNFLNGPLRGPFEWSKDVKSNTQSMCPVIHVEHR